MPFPEPFMHAMSFWACITRLADTNVTVPLALLLAAWLGSRQRGREALWWLLLFCGGLGIVAASKIAYAGWGIGIASLDFTGFSGHAMRAAAVAPAFARLALPAQSRRARVLAQSLALVFAVLVAISRLVLHQHSPSEAISGLALGALTGFGFVGLERGKPALSWHPAAAVACALAVAIGAPAKPAPTEQWIDAIALRLSGHDQPYRRGALHPPGDI